MTLWGFLFRAAWHPEWVQEHADGSCKKTADCKALQDYHEEQIYSPSISKSLRVFSIYWNAVFIVPQIAVLFQVQYPVRMQSKMLK